MSRGDRKRSRSPNASPIIGRARRSSRGYCSPRRPVSARRALATARGSTPAPAWPLVVRARLRRNRGRVGLGPRALLALEGEPFARGHAAARALLGRGRRLWSRVGRGPVLVLRGTMLGLGVPRRARFVVRSSLARRVLLARVRAFAARRTIASLRARLAVLPRVRRRSVLSGSSRLDRDLG